MSGYRANCGFGVLPRTDTDSVGMIPAQFDVYNKTYVARSQVERLTHRFGAGIELSINRNRNNNYLQDIGYREFTTATSGMYDLDFTVSGAFVPEMSSWIEYLMMSDMIYISSGATVVTQSGDAVTNPQPDMAVYVKPQATETPTIPTTGKIGQVIKYTGATAGGYTQNHYYICKSIAPNRSGVMSITWEPMNGDDTSTNVGFFKSPILYGDYTTYIAKTQTQTNSATAPTSGTLNQVIKYTGASASGIFTPNHYYRCTKQSSTNPATEAEWKDLGTIYDGDKMTFAVYSYINMDGPKYFDTGYQFINENTTNGGLNEIGLLVGCVIDSASINYESGSDAQVKFTINAIALNEYIYTTSEFFDYNAILDYEVPLQPLVAGCVSVLKDGSYVPIAQTDSAGISVNNNTTKLGNCLKLTYSSVALGALGIEMNISTYANDPNKFMAHMYGYESMTDGYQYEIAKQPYGIDKMKIRSDNSSSIMQEGSQILDINLTKVYVGSANRTYNVDNAVMDEPDLRPRKVQFVVGYVPLSVS